MPLMKQPLWAINSSLLFLSILGQLILVFLHTSVPRRASIEPDIITRIEKNINASVDVANIYGANDLFATFTLPTSPAHEVEPAIPAIPDTPALIPLSIPVETPRVFIAPLPVTLKGVIYAHDQPSQSVAIVQFQNSKEEMNYRVGELINDAQILKIYQNRIIVVRSNGQQEILYLRENEAAKDFNLQSAKNIATLQIPLKTNLYHIPVDQLTENVKTLGQFIDLLDLTTAYKKGKSIGCRVGKAEKDSLASKLGLMRDDIIEQVDGLPITDIASRVLAFDHIITKNIGDIITVHVQRSNNPVILKYILSKNMQDATSEIKSSDAKQAKTITQPNAETLYTIEQEKKQMLERKIKLAPTMHQLEAEERKKMFQARNKNMTTANFGAKG